MYTISDDSSRYKIFVRQFDSLAREGRLIIMGTTECELSNRPAGEQGSESVTGGANRAERRGSICASKHAIYGAHIGESSQ